MEECIQLMQEIQDFTIFLCSTSAIGDACVLFEQRQYSVTQYHVRKATLFSY